MSVRDRRGRRTRGGRASRGSDQASVGGVQAKAGSKTGGVQANVGSKTGGRGSSSRSIESSSKSVAETEESSSKSVAETESKEVTKRRIGRARGTPNRVTVQVKEAMTLAFEGIGGVDRLIKWADEHPTIFYRLYARLLPKQITGANDGPIQFEEIRRTIVDPVYNRRANRETPVTIEYPPASGGNGRRTTNGDGQTKDGQSE